MPTVYEFFAGGGMARLGLGDSWTSLFANDFDPKKAAAYCDHFGSKEMHVGDVAAVKTSQLPGQADLVWASFPCQDLSLAGNGAGLDGDRSGTFWPFWKLVLGLRREGREPAVIVLENVCGLLTSNGGNDFREILKTTSNAGYRVGAVVVDAAAFLPQSRPRLFFVAVNREIDIPDELVAEGPNSLWHTSALAEVQKSLKTREQNNWVWWNMPAPPARTILLSDLIEDNPKGVNWHTQAETDRLLEMMSPLNLEKVRDVQRSGVRTVGTLYKRIRNGQQRAEVRFDGLAGCLRTPSGGSSRQTILLVHKKKISSRLLSSREVARLMGIPEAYRMPIKYNDAYHLAGDGLAVPVVRYLAANLFESILAARARVKQAA